MSHKDNERYYWFKLKDSLLKSEKVDFLMQQDEGMAYVLLYQCLCLKLVNNNGVLAVELGDGILVAYTPEKIARETKGWFSVGTIRAALGLYRKLGLIGARKDGIEYIVDFDELIGSETHGAERKRLGKGGGKEEEKKWKKGGKFPPDIEIEKEIDIRDRKKNKDIEKDLVEKEEVSNEEIDTLLDELYGKEKEKCKTNLN